MKDNNKRERVQVVVRLRPEKEGNKSAIQRVVFCNGTNEIILVPPERRPLCELQANESRKRKATTRVFTFDGVMSEMTSQVRVLLFCGASWWYNWDMNIWSFISLFFMVSG